MAEVERNNEPGEDILENKRLGEGLHTGGWPRNGIVSWPESVLVFVSGNDSDLETEKEAKGHLKYKCYYFPFIYIQYLKLQMISP